jgi:hypothetical protein
MAKKSFSAGIIPPYGVAIGNALRSRSDGRRRKGDRRTPRLDAVAGIIIDCSCLTLPAN